MAIIKKFILIGLAGFCFWGCQKKEGANWPNNYGLDLNFIPFFKTDSLKLGKVYTIDNLNENITISTFKIYISNIKLTQLNGEETPLLGQYFLLDASKPSTLKLPLSVLSNKYKSISFLLGVDSVRNVSGAQTGALDPINTMFWTWNSGYIMAKLEGTSTSSNVVNNKVEYHIGGFKQENSVLKTVTVLFNNNNQLAISDAKASVVNINIDVQKWFIGTSNLSIATSPVCTMPGALAQKYANNYVNMFQLGSVINF